MPGRPREVVVTDEREQDGRTDQELQRDEGLARGSFRAVRAHVPVNRATAECNAEQIDGQHAGERVRRVLDEHPDHAIPDDFVPDGHEAGAEDQWVREAPQAGRRIGRPEFDLRQFG